MKPLELSLTTRIVLAFMLLAVSLLATVSVLSYNSARESLKSAAMSELLTLAIEKEAALNNWFNQNLDGLAKLSTHPELQDDLADMLASAPGLVPAFKAAI